MKATRATLLETGDVLSVRTTDAGLVVAIPDAVRDQLPERVAYCIRLSDAV
jgi:hypothetical protein